MSDIIITSICEKCKFGTVDDSNKARVKVFCSYKEREYHFGQCVPCDNYTKSVVEESGENDEQSK